MLFNFQLPFVDLRGYLSENTHKILMPTWPLPDEGEFIHFSGDIGTRKRSRYISKGSMNRLVIKIRDGLDKEIFSAENQYCFARHFVKFPTLHDRGTLQCAFRRIFVDPSGICRMDIGFKTEISSQEDFEMIQQELFHLPVCMQTTCAYHKDPSCDCGLTPLYMVGPRIAYKYLEATTYRKIFRTRSIPDWWVQAGTPMMVAIFSEKEKNLAAQVTSAYAFMGAEEIKATQTAYELLHHRHFLGRKRNRKLEAWYLICQNSAERSDNVVRNFRINLLRLHAEKSHIIEIARSLKKGHLTLDEMPNTSNTRSSLLRQHLEAKTQTLITSGDSVQSENILLNILIRVFQYDQWANPEDYDYVQYVMELVNPGLFSKVRQILDRKEAGDKKTLIKNLIEQNQIEQAIELLKEVASQSLDVSFTVNEIIILQYQWNDLANSIRNNAVTYEIIRQEKGRMVLALLEFSEQIPKANI